FIQRNVRNHVRDQLDINFEHILEIEFKNYSTQVRDFRVVMDDKARALMMPVVKVAPKLVRPRRQYAAAAILALAIVGGGLLAWQPWKPAVETASIERMALPLPDLPSIAVLPFENMSGDPEQEYFADGMTDDLITDLSKVSGLFVIARNSSFAYKGKPTKVQQVAEDLGVRYVLEGSVRRVGDQVRINAQLIDAVGGHHLWAERYDGSMSDVFALQDNVIRKIVAALAVTVTSDETALVVGAETNVPEAYDAFLRGWEEYRSNSYEGFTAAQAHLEKATELDPEFSRAYAALAAAVWKANNYYWDWFAGTQWELTRARGMEMLARALENPTPLAYAIAAEVHALEGRHDEALAAIDRAIAMAPNDADNLLSKANVMNVLGRAEEAEAAVRTAMRLNPQFPQDYLPILAQSLLNQRRYEEAAEVAERVVELRDEFPFDYVTLASAYGHLGRIQEANAAVEKYHQAFSALNYPTPLTVQEMGYWWYWDMYDYDPGYRENLKEGLRKAGVPEGAGTDLAYDEYRSLISKDEGVYFVEGATRIAAGTAKALHERGVVFIDVRDGGSYDAGHVPNAFNLDLNVDFDEEHLSRLVAKDQEVVLGCFGEHCPWAAYASAKAILWGFTRVYYFAGGFPEWQDVGYPVETAPDT
ncbi:MAG: rhodanese-like domain-containing protein, partial [Alphaproteobacteria bacterium]